MKRLTEDMYRKWRESQDGPRPQCAPRSKSKAFHIPLPPWREAIVDFGVKLNIPATLANHKETPMRPVHLTLALLLAVVLYAANGPDVEASANFGCNGPAACGAPDLADFSCSEPAAVCGGDERSIVRRGERWFPGKGVLKALGTARDWNPRFRPHGRFGRCG